MNEIDLIKKIHAGADDTCYSSILTTWEEKTRYEQLEELMGILCKGVDMETAIEMLHIEQKIAKSLLKECEKIRERVSTKCMYDRMLSTSEFFRQCGSLIQAEAEDTFFSLNSFYRPEKAGSNVRHLNAFVLDLDYYKDERYKDWNPERFYNRKVQKKLPFLPTAVIDSGRGLYVIYSFQHCSYHMEHLYRSIMKAFYNQFKELRMDAGAMLLTQVIRLPGSINSRSGRQVSVLQYNDTDYRIQDFAVLLPWSQEEVIAFRSNKKDMKQEERKVKEKKDIDKRKPYYADFHEDMRKLIILRNRNGHYEGYREILLYLVRERAIWSGYTIDESVELAMELNKEMHFPLSAKEVEKVCRPSDGRKSSSFDTIIDKLEITIPEQKKLKIVRRKWLKKSVYAKRKRKQKLTNLTKKQQELLERRTRVCEMKNVNHFKNKDIADILNTDRSTVTRDLQYIKKNPADYKILLKAYMEMLKEKRETDDYRLRLTYQRQEQLQKWMGYAQTALDYLVRELDVAVT
ncbi:hypothetical protein MKC54_09815 [[Clostridium] innocuum]|nr:hypothetical protein [[Clostridium] innocuum]MCR0577183.1 hypothetical protein [[Clostridium] innocuum]